MKYLVVLLITFFVIQHSKLFAASSYARGEFCFEDRLVSRSTDDDFNEACMQYHLASLWAGSDGTVYEFVLTLTPIQSGHYDQIQLILNPGLGSKPMFRMDLNEDGTETNTIVYGGDTLVDGSKMQRSSCFGGGIPLFPDHDCPTNTVVVAGFGMGTTYLNMSEGMETTISKLIALKNITTGDTIDYTSVEAGIAKVMHKPLDSAIPGEKIHWYDAFVDTSATELDGNGQSVTLGDCDPRAGELNASCGDALSTYVTSKQTNIKNRAGATHTAMTNSANTGLQVAQHNGTSFDRGSTWTLGSGSTSNSGSGSSDSELVSYFGETNHSTIRTQRTKCDYVRCYWYKASP